MMMSSKLICKNIDMISRSSESKQLLVTLLSFLVENMLKHSNLLRENYTELKVKLHEEKENTTMEDVERIRKYIAQELSLPPHALLFYAVEEGSVIAKFWIKSPLFDTSYNLKHKPLIELEKKDEILEVTVDGKRLEMNMKESDLCLKAEFAVGSNSCSQLIA